MLRPFLRLLPTINARQLAWFRADLQGGMLRISPPGRELRQSALRSQTDCTRRRAAVADRPAPRPPRQDARVPRLRRPPRLAHRPDAPRGRGLSAGRGSGHADRPGDAPRRGRPAGVPAGTEGDLRLELTTPPAPVPALPRPDADDPGRTVRHAPGPPHDRHDPHRFAAPARIPLLRRPGRRRSPHPETSPRRRRRTVHGLGRSAPARR